MSQLWWHVYGAEIADLAEDEDGNPGMSWGLLILGESTRSPDDERIPDMVPRVLGAEAKYLASFDHDPTEEERDALAPEEYRDEN